tara:strand:+ start:202 stop:474 length:273 start_codon:yes stop_codon:yes gene_type:complete
VSNQFNPLATEDLNGVNSDQQALWDKHNNLIHQVFEQNPQGRELLAAWKETLIFVPTVTPNSTQFEAGIAEGKKTVVREILLAINSVEGK